MKLGTGYVFSHGDTHIHVISMIRKQWKVIFLLFALIASCGLCYAATEPTTLTMTPKVKASEPYDDEIFLNLVTPVISSLNDKTLNSSERIDVQSAYYTIVAMKVSPDFYPIALNTTRLLFYLVSSSEAFEELDKDSGLGTHNKDMRDSLKAQANADRNAAEEAWHGISMLYPNSTLF